MWVFKHFNIYIPLKDQDVAIDLQEPLQVRVKVKDALIVKDLLDDKTLLAFRNLANCYVVDANEVNAYLVSTFSSVIIEKAALKTITKEG